MTSSNIKTIRPHRATSRAARWATALAVAGTLSSVPAMVSAAPSGAAPIVAANRIETLRLDCAASSTTSDRVTDESVRYAVGCRWSVPTVDSAAGVRLLRIIIGSDQPRTQIFATRNLAENTHLDAPLRPDRRYAYRVQALNRDGGVVASSRTVTVAVPSIDVEPLRLDCRAVDGEASATRAHIGCRWTVPSTAQARTLTLWRSVDGAARERVASFDQPFESSYRDVVPAGTSRVVYAVVAVDGDGSIVARSRADAVALRSQTSSPERAVRLVRKGSAD